MQYSTVQYSAVQCSTVQYSTVQYSTVQYSTAQYSTVQYLPSTLKFFQCCCAVMLTFITVNSRYIVSLSDQRVLQCNSFLLVQHKYQTSDTIRDESDGDGELNEGGHDMM